MLLPHALRAVNKEQTGLYLVGSSSGDSGASSVTLTTPTGTQAGDLLVAFGYSAGAGTLWSVDGGGWTITNATNSTAPRLTAFYFTHVSAASYVFRQNSLSADVGVTLMAFRSGAVDVFSTPTAAADPQVIPSVTATSSGSIQLVTAGGNTNHPVSTPSGFTQIYLNTGGNQPDWGVYYKQNISSGATGTVSVDMDASSSTSGMQLIVKPV
jgi:hypothetical protein